jgi:lipopolysaccharide export system permease protein
MEADSRAFPLSILRRYVLMDVARAFSLALLTLSAIFVLFMVAATARDIGLSPQDIVRLVPYVIPSTLPYTIPVSLLFSVTVVYGRLAGDNEIIAVKTAGVSVMHVLLPTYALALFLSVTLVYLSSEWIPECTRLATLVLYSDFEDTFYKYLKRDREVNNEKWPFFIKAEEIDGKVMKNATFKHRSKENGQSDYDFTIEAEEATMNFDMNAKMIHVYFKNGEMVRKNPQSPDIMLMNSEDPLDIPLPPGSTFDPEKKLQHFTSSELALEMVTIQQKLNTERQRAAIKTGFAFATGRTDQLNWGDVQEAARNHAYLVRRMSEVDTERQLRISMAFGSLLFVILGAPVGIMFARRDFLSAFMTCFMPIITVYYPLMLFGQNMSKEALLPASISWISLWLGNLILAVLAGLVLPPVIKH